MARPHEPGGERFRATPAVEEIGQGLPDELRRFVQSVSWRFAKTYAATWPHEYVVRTPENSTKRCWSLLPATSSSTGRTVASTPRSGSTITREGRCTGRWTRLGSQRRLSIVATKRRRTRPGWRRGPFPDCRHPWLHRRLPADPLTGEPADSRDGSGVCDFIAFIGRAPLEEQDRGLVSHEATKDSAAPPADVPNQP